MLQTANRSDLIVFEDLVDDATVAPPRRPKTFEFTNEWFADGRTVARGAEWAHET